jgi:hypothetical protein
MLPAGWWCKKKEVQSRLRKRVQRLKQHGGSEQQQPDRSAATTHTSFGAYTINVRLHKITHHLEGALVSSDIGKNFNRSFRLRRSADPIRNQRIVSWEADDRTHLEKSGALLFRRGPLRLTGGCTRAVLERRGWRRLEPARNFIASGSMVQCSALRGDRSRLAGESRSIRVTGWITRYPDRIAR